MEHIYHEHHEDKKNDEVQKQRKAKEDYLIPASIVIAALVISSAWVYTARLKGISDKNETQVSESQQISQREKTIPVVWGDLGMKMVKAGVIDRERFLEVYASRGGLRDAEKKLLDSSDNGALLVNDENAGVLLNLFWALGLGNKNEILEQGEMVDKKYGGDPGKFASTGGWILAKGDPMNHYSAHHFFELSSEQQALVEEVSKNIFRPCCGNSTHFPDCNHGMAMLGLLELMASQGATEAQMYTAALTMNSFWFPEQYDNIESFLKTKGVSSLNAINPKDILSAQFSSASGYQGMMAEFTQPQSGKTPTRKSGGGCGV